MKRKPSPSVLPNPLRIPRRTAGPAEIQLVRGDRLNIVSNVVLEELRRQFSDHTDAELLAGVLAAGVIIARGTGLLPGELLALVRTLLQVEIEAVPGAGTAPNS